MIFRFHYKIRHTKVTIKYTVLYNTKVLLHDVIRKDFFLGKGKVDNTINKTKISRQ